MNINTKEYWDKRFGTDDWLVKGGPEQTTALAQSQIKYFRIDNNFKGTLLDFGCGLGDAIPIYKQNYPNASIIGIDISEEAIKKCITKYGEIAEFRVGTYDDIPNADIIISSNVFEHLSNDIEIAKKLTNKSSDLYIIVPYKETIDFESEHINSYDETYFKELGNYHFEIFLSKGWTQFGLKGLIYNVYLKNIVRPFFGKKIQRRRKQIMYHFKSDIIQKIHADN